MSDAIITVEDLGKRYRIVHQQQGGKTLRETLTNAGSALLRGLNPNGKRSGEDTAAQTSEEFWALRNVSFEVKQGEVVGFIGRNGAGKSTLLKLLSRISEPTEGRIHLRGRVASLLEVGTGFHPELTGRENVFLNGAILGMRREEIKRKFDEIVDFAGTEKFLDTPVKRYSSGMYVRLAFAVAAYLEPEILIVDEVLSVGDAEFQKKCLGKMQDVSRGGRTVLFVSHNLQTVRQLCNRAAVLEKGTLVYCGEVVNAINRYSGAEGGTASAFHDLSDYPRRQPPEGARLLAVDCRDESGAPAVRARRAEDLRVNVSFRVERQVNEFDLAMALIHVEGQRIFSEVYSDQHATLNLSPGNYEIQFSIPLRFLKLEAYFLVLAVLENGALIDQIEGIPMPEIIDPEANPRIEAGRWGVVRLPLSWDSVRQFDAV